MFDGKRYVKGDGMGGGNHGPGGGGGGGGGAEQQVDYPVPSNRAGVVIGKGGLSFKSLL